MRLFHLLVEHFISFPKGIEPLVIQCIPFSQKNQISIVVNTREVSNNTKFIVKIFLLCFKALSLIEEEEG